MSTQQPLRESDLIFSSASSALKDALGELKRANLSIKNRLRSIKEDSKFVTKVADAYNLPLIANERCGSWYIPPERKAGSAYFKSTDGHFHQWGFSLRRLNLQVLDVLEEYGGCIIVDSTRRGKSMPDALSKTVPIWIAVLNRLIFPDDADAHDLRTPLDVISESEHAQIEARLDECVAAARGLQLDLQRLRDKLHNKPIQVTWQRPGDTLPEEPDNDPANLVVLCTASNQTSNATSATSDYVQGAADDPESWSCGLDSSCFWSHRNELLSTAEDDLPQLIDRLMADARESSSIRSQVLIKPTSCLWIGDNAAATSQGHGFDVVVSCSIESIAPLSKDSKPQYVNLVCSTGKIGSRQLRAQLPKLEQLRSSLTSTSKVLVTCESGKDLGVGAALAMLCMFFDEQGTWSHQTSELNVNKTVIKQRLSWIMVSMPDASPSRATLQSVNAFLMG
ncbi:hypothetical protein PRZ48_007258 [Zasmidium cellare]|uniref:Initiator tRNA phosphoribosyl transferase n=1 Tax=Zasmidium cellare TaxID=395010 RepID=A0ABR0EJ94_ZASCE|nr:hypothetical protein PRZ48_007258 [Zasmidium cellare]